MTSRFLGVIEIADIWYTTYHILLIVCNNDDSIWHRFEDIITITVYVTACDLGKSFTVEKIVEITSQECFH